MRQLAFALLLFITLPVFACTTFVLEGGDRVYLGKNFDWDWDEGFVVINQKNVQKRAIVLSTNAVMWTSKYGSVTFNQFGRELPFGGMNEAGLVIECMWLDGTKYPPIDSRPEINMLQWIQYQLDNHTTVKEVIASDKKIRLEQPFTRARIHYLVCDAKGDTATIEFLDGVMKVHSGKDLGYRALANSTYEQSIAVMREDKSRADTSQPLPKKDSISRFCRAAARADTFKVGKNSKEDVAYAFETLNQVHAGNRTVWQFVYDAPARKIFFRTRSNQKERTVDLKSLDFACGQATQIADIHADGAAQGAVKFHPLADQEHREFLTKFFAQESVKKQVGDVTAMLDPVLAIIRTYKCAGQ